MKNKVKYAIAALAPTVAMAVPVFAEGGSSGTAQSAVVSSMTTLANDMVATGTALIPIGLTVVGITMVVRYGVRVFKGIAKP